MLLKREIVDTLHEKNGNKTDTQYYQNFGLTLQSIPDGNPTEQGINIIVIVHLFIREWKKQNICDKKQMQRNRENPVTGYLTDANPLG